MSWPAVPSNTSSVPWPGWWVKAAAAGRWSRSSSVSLCSIPAGQSFSQSLWRGLAVQQLSLGSLSAAVLVSQNFVFASVVTSQERIGKGSALLQSPGNSGCPEVLHPPGHSSLHTECKSLFKCLCRWISALRCCGAEHRHHS